MGFRKAVIGGLTGIVLAASACGKPIPESQFPEPPAGETMQATPTEKLPEEGKELSSSDRIFLENMYLKEGLQKFVDSQDYESLCKNIDRALKLVSNGMLKIYHEKGVGDAKDKARLAYAWTLHYKAACTYNKACDMIDKETMHAKAREYDQQAADLFDPKIEAEKKLYKLFIGYRDMAPEDVDAEMCPNPINQ